MDNLVKRVVFTLCEDIGTPRAKLVKELVAGEMWTQLQELECRPSDYADADSYFKDAIITDLLRKCDLPSSVDKEAVAVQTFLSCEAQNCATNARLTRFMPETLLIEDSQDESVFQFITEWRKEVDYVLGNLPDTLTPRFSGGATFADTGSLTTIPDKMSSTPTVYSSSRCILPFWERTSWSRALLTERPLGSDPCTVRGNIFFTVPKNGKTFRGCCKEASIPVSFQLDVGRIIKTRLTRIGIDLQVGKPKHQALARAASISGAQSTIDQSNASDTVCRVLPLLLLQRGWGELLSSLRATHTRVKGKWFRLEKFSSMGNGFTFELETLIFSTLARVITRREGGNPDHVTCYGDDLIVDTEHSPSVLAALKFFGFTPNVSKTFVEGPFRESCGGDYWSGMPVRAHFIESLPNEPQEWISLANGLWRLGHVDGEANPYWSMLRRAWFRALDPIPVNIRRCRGPQILGDIVITDDPEKWSYTETPRRISRPTAVSDGDCTGWELKWLKAYVPMPSVLPWHHWKPAVHLASCTLGLPSRGVTPRGGVTGYRIGAVPYGIASTWTPNCP